MNVLRKLEDVLECMENNLIWECLSHDQWRQWLEGISQSFPLENRFVKNETNGQDCIADSNTVLSMSNGGIITGV